MGFIFFFQNIFPGFNFSLFSSLNAPPNFGPAKGTISKIKIRNKSCFTVKWVKVCVSKGTANAMK